jgi:hypothetical protein
VVLLQLPLLLQLATEQGQVVVSIRARQLRGVM